MLGFNAFNYRVRQRGGVFYVERQTWLGWKKMSFSEGIGYTVVPWSLTYETFRESRFASANDAMIDMQKAFGNSATRVFMDRDT